ncbi:nuclease-related domain-containing protein, partial [Bacillus sp. JJ1503]|uniref:nuclease-related domain-containing protein n=1 Tax=Bacillus sp. JJ1503 TaxID=3122956 RepID=UPI002FFECBE0
MIIKPRCEPEELRIMRHLHTRVNLTEKEAKKFLTMEKGYEGEKRFDELFENISEDCTILNDLLLENSNSVFQIDSLLIYDGTVHI